MGRSKTTRQRKQEKGQFWTPAWVAEAMATYVSRDANEVFDPGVGKGAFYTALKKVAPKKTFVGADIDPHIIAEAKKEGIFKNDAKLEIRDFILNPPKRRFKAIIANPPYIRHHHLSAEYKNSFRRIGLLTLGEMLDGRAGLHVYFLIKALSLLDKDGSLAFIMPADTCEGIFSGRLWSWISKNFRIDGVITFDPKATPFPGVDTNAVVFLISNKKPLKKLVWARCLVSGNKELTRFVKNGLPLRKFKGLEVYERTLEEALSVGLSRKPLSDYTFEYRLNDFARVMRGVATGANDFFFLTEGKAKEIGLPSHLLVRAIGRTRDAAGTSVTSTTLLELEKKGRPTFLFSPQVCQLEDMPGAVRSYLIEGEKIGLAKRALISTRKPWYKMEKRNAPPFLFAYLGRRNARFIKNEAGVVPLTGFLCVYPLSTDKSYIGKLWKVLQHPETVANLHLVGKSYGSGAVKVEPRSLEKLPINAHLIKKIGLRPPKLNQSLFG